MKLVFTLGFDEKFAIRSIIRNCLQEKDEVYAVLPEGVDTRSEKAFFNLKEFINKAFNNVKVDRIYVPIDDFPLAVSQLRGFLKEMGVGNKILNLSGGQRILIVALLVAASSLDINVDIEIETEDSKLVHRFPVSLMRAQNLDPVDLKILDLLSKESLDMAGISERLGISRPTVWRRLEKLIGLGLAEKIDKGEYRLSESGKSFTH